MIPTGTLIGPPVFLLAGAAFNLPIQCKLKPTGQANARFKAGDNLSAYVYQKGIPTAIFQPAVSWYTAPDFGTNVATQSGYDEGQVWVTGSSVQAQAFFPGVDYFLVVKWSPQTDPDDEQEIAVIPLKIGRVY